MARYGLTPFAQSNMDFFRDFFDLSPVNHEMDYPELYKLNVDVVDKGDHYELTADLPGFTKDDINIEVNEDVLTIEARRNEQKEEKKENYIFKERRSGSYVRRFDVSGVKADAITGKFTNGVVTLNLPKREEDVKTSKQIELSGDEE